MANEEVALDLQTPQWSDFLACPICCRKFATGVHRPVSLPCGHTLCHNCLTRLAAPVCPFDNTPLQSNEADALEAVNMPVNTALLSLCGAVVELPVNQIVAAVGHEHVAHYQCIARCLEELALLLRPLLDAGAGGLVGKNLFLGGNASGLSALSEPMQRQLVALLNSQVVLDAGRRRCARTCRAVAECAVLELLDAHQSSQAQAVQLWAAVRSRGCQFLGPAMQEEVLRLILSALQDGSALSRKVLVLYVVKRLEAHYPQASKTAVGHVVQLLYRASCFMVMKRQDESSLMQLKDEFRDYETLRREHDAQVVQIAQEAGLRISADHWSALLYGDVSHRLAMQAILKRVCPPLTLNGAVHELYILMQRTSDPDNLCRLRAQFELLCSTQCKDLNHEAVPLNLATLSDLLQATKDVIFALVDYVRRHSIRRGNDLAIHKYKTSMCRDLVLRGSCPRGKVCTFAHSEDELDWHRSVHGSGMTPVSAGDNFSLDVGADLLQNMVGPSASALPQTLISMRCHVTPSALPSKSSLTTPPHLAQNILNDSTFSPQGYNFFRTSLPVYSQSCSTMTATSLATQAVYTSPMMFSGIPQGPTDRHRSYLYPDSCLRQYETNRLYQASSSSLGNYRTCEHTSNILNDLRDKKYALMVELERNQRDPCHPQSVASLAQSVEDSMAANRAIYNLGCINTTKRVEDNLLLHPQSSFQPDYLPWTRIDRVHSSCKHDDAAVGSIPHNVSKDSVPLSDNHFVEEEVTFWVPQVTEESDSNTLELVAYWCAGGPDRDPQFVSEDEELPAGTTFVSRFGPISRLVKTKSSPGEAITATAQQDISTQPINAVGTSDCMMSVSEVPAFFVYSPVPQLGQHQVAAQQAYTQLAHNAAIIQQKAAMAAAAVAAGANVTASIPLVRTTSPLAVAAVEAATIGNAAAAAAITHSKLHVELARLNQQINLVEKDARIRCELDRLMAMEKALKEVLFEDKIEVGADVAADLHINH